MKLAEFQALDIIAQFDLMLEKKVSYLGYCYGIDKTHKLFALYDFYVEYTVDETGKGFVSLESFDGDDDKMLKHLHLIQISELKLKFQ